MPLLRKQIADLIEAHLEEIVDATMTAYVRLIPAVSRASSDERRRIRAATARTARTFLAMYADPAASPREFVQQARAATVERAGVLLGREDIGEMIRIGRQTIYGAARRLVRAEFDVSDERRAELERQIDAFVDEVERSDDAVPRVTPDVLSEWLARAEHEGSDVQ